MKGLENCSSHFSIRLKNSEECSCCWLLKCENSKGWLPGSIREYEAISLDNQLSQTVVLHSRVATSASILDPPPKVGPVVTRMVGHDPVCFTRWQSHSTACEPCSRVGVTVTHPQRTLEWYMAINCWRNALRTMSNLNLSCSILVKNNV